MCVSSHLCTFEYSQHCQSVEARHHSIQFVQLRSGITVVFGAQIVCCYAMPAPPCVEYSSNVEVWSHGI